VVRVGCVYDAETDTIDPGSHEPEWSKNLREVIPSGLAAIVIDDRNRGRLVADHVLTTP
jgi:hypothetical protein